MSKIINIKSMNVQKINKKSSIIGHVVDDLDKRILKQLLGDSRISYRQIAKRLKVSPNTVLSRVGQMKTSGLIKFHTTILDHEKLGYELTVVTEVIVSKGKLLETDKEVSKIPGVCAVYDVTGESDAIVVAKFKTRDALSNFTKTLLSMPYVERTNTHVVLTTVKEDFRLVP